MIHNYFSLVIKKDLSQDGFLFGGSGMNIGKLLDVIHVGIDFDSDKRISESIKFINRVQNMTIAEKDVIIASFECGPLYDGDIPSKTGRDLLLADNFMSKIVVKGDDGYNACTYLGARAYRLLKAMKD